MRWLPPLLLLAVALVSTWDARAARRGLTVDMIQTALDSAHINTQPGTTLQLLERREGRWHDFRLDTFKIIVDGNSFTIQGETTQLN